MSLTDVAITVVIIFALAIAFFGTHFMLGQTVDRIVNVTVINESNKSAAAFSSVKTLTNKFDYLLFITFMGLALLILISGWFIAGNPIMMFIYFIVNVIIVVISTFLANTWEYVTQASIFGLTINNFPITNHIMLYLPYYTVGLAFLGMVVMFGKPFVTGRNPGDWA